MSGVHDSFQLNEQNENLELAGYQPLPHTEIFRELYGIALECFVCRPADGESAKLLKLLRSRNFFQ